MVYIFDRNLFKSGLQKKEKRKEEFLDSRSSISPVVVGRAQLSFLIHRNFWSSSFQTNAQGVTSRSNGPPWATIQFDISSKT